METLRTMLEAMRTQTAAIDPKGAQQGLYDDFLASFPSAITANSTAWTNFQTGFQQNTQEIFGEFFTANDVAFTSGGMNPLDKA
jgi:hypothetical protein